ncbi:hypothetical protein OG589_44155 [Sphaerisporangium sp. NBC_01403]|uniref:hypothetical protein n=1 Tax=Sphaerisporangium sp. NBC_01403 TaxID=2903599 RepID=UPI00324CC8BA
MFTTFSAWNTSSADLGFGTDVRVDVLDAADALADGDAVVEADAATGGRIAIEAPENAMTSAVVA